MQQFLQGMSYLIQLPILCGANDHEHQAKGRSEEYYNDITK